MYYQSQEIKQELKKDSEVFDNQELLNDNLSAVKKELEVNLVFPTTSLKHKELPYSHAVLKRGLEELGISTQIFSAFTDREEIHERLTDDSKFQVWGLGTYFSTINEMSKLANDIQDSGRNNRFVVLGGSGTDDYETRKKFSAFKYSFDTMNYG